MGKQLKYHANIMLDLECVAVEAHNPALIELGAVHFDIVTGAELRSLKTPISLQSCLDHGLLSDDDTISWVERNIPQTLATSKTTAITLEYALFKFSNFVRSCVAATKKTLRELGRDPEFCQAKIWGNGVIADNVWIKSAYRACNIERPWKFTGDMCVRTMVNSTSSITGRDYTREVVRQGRHHDALDDCRHQVKYLVLAMNSLAPKETPKKTVEPGKPITRNLVGENPLLESPSPHTPPSERPNSLLSRIPGNVTIESLVAAAKELLEESASAVSNPQPAPAKPALPTPVTSFSEGDISAKEVPNLGDSPSTPPKRRRGPSSNPAVQRPGMLPTPDTSFSSVNGEVEDIPGLVSKSATDIQEKDFSEKIGQAMKSQGLLSAETSFCVPNENDEVADPPSPTPTAKHIKV